MESEAREHVARKDSPRIRESGSFGASATSKPPNPHPISAISTSLVRVPTDLFPPDVDDSSVSVILKLG